MTWDQLATATPLNKTAALVTSKSRDAADEDSRTERHRNLLLLHRQANRVLLATTDPKQRKMLGVRIYELQLAMNAEKGGKKRSPLENYFVDSAREMLPKALFDTILRDARKKHDAEQQVAEVSV